MHPSINIDRLESALKAIIQHHDALRLRVCRDGSNYTQYVVEMSDAPVLEVFDLSNFMPSDQVSRIREIGISMQASFRFDGSPLFKAAFLNYGFEAPGRLIVLAHHLIMDEYSFGILMADLVRTYSQLSTGEEVVLPARTTSFKRWSEVVANYAQSRAARNECTYWRSRSWHLVKPLPVDIGNMSQSYSRATMGMISQSLNSDHLSALRQVLSLASGRVAFVDLVLVALKRTISTWSKSSTVLIEMIVNARRDIYTEPTDVSRTVGWLVAHYPLLLSVDEQDVTVDDLRLIQKELADLPNAGASYGALRYLNEETAREMCNIPDPEILLTLKNNVDFDQSLSTTDTPLFEPAMERYGNKISPKTEVKHNLRVSIVLSSSALTTTWAYNTGSYFPATIEKLISNFLGELGGIVCRFDTSDSV